MTEGEYLHHFIRFSSFFQKLIDTEAKKVNIFLKGLKLTICKVNALMRLATYDEAVSKPYSSEENAKIQQSELRKEWAVRPNP